MGAPKPRKRPDKKAIRWKIRTLLADKNPASLETVKNEIARDLCQPFLPSEVENYVDYKYFKYCLTYLECGILKSDSLAFKNASELQQLGKRIFSATQLEALPLVITAQQPYYLLLWQERRLLTTSHQQLILRRIQSAVAKVIKRITSSAASKQNGVVGYLRLMREYYLTLKNVILKTTSNSNVWNYGNATAYPSVTITEYEAAFMKLKAELVSYRRREFGEQYSLLEKSVQTAESELETSIFKREEIFVEYKHGRHVLVFQKPVILLGAHLKTIEDMLRGHPKVEEVHLVASEVIFIDCYLENDMWHGKNILVFGNQVEVVIPGLKWDLSGLHGKSGSGQRAPSGTSDSQPDGQDGEDGIPGKSGGYCTFIADTFRNMNRLTIKMNGGKGGSGQSAGNGKNGQDGTDGAEMSLSTLINEFPTGAKFSGLTAGSDLDTTLERLDRHIVRSEQNWNGGSSWETWYRRGYFSDGKFVEWCCTQTQPLWQIRRTYCLLRGAPGTGGEVGGFGGNKGMGGKGGFEGALATYKLLGGGASGAVPMNNVGVLCEASAGEDGDDGEDGKDGANGRSGRNGRDVGYTDSSGWGDSEKFGPSTLEIRNCSDSDSVWCGFYETDRTIRTASRDPPQPVQNNRKKVTKVREKVAATRNNTVNHSLVVAEYAQVVINQRGTINAEMEFQRTMSEVINQSEQLVEEETKARNNKKEQKNHHHHVKVKVSRPAPNEGKFKQSTGKENRMARRKGLLDGNKDPLQHAPRADNKDLRELALRKMRLEAFEKIRGKVEQGWGNYDRTRVEYQKKPTSTGDGASALHALFGQASSTNLGFYEAPPTRSRREVKEHLKANVGTLMEGDEAWVNLRESLFAYFTDKSIDNNGAEGQNNFKMLNKYRAIFEKNPNEFSWEELRQDKKAVEEYLEFLGEPAVPFLISDLRLIARAYGILLELYMSHDGSSSEYLPLRPGIPGETRVIDPKAVRIAVNENLEFSRMGPVLKSDWSAVHEQMRGIVNDVYGLKGIPEMQEYVTVGKFGVAKYVAAEQLFASEEEKLRAVQEISGGIFGGGRMHEETLVVETSLLRWPNLALKAFHNRVMLLTQKDDVEGQQDQFRVIFYKLTEAILNGSGDDRGNEQLEKELAPYMWITVAHPITQWSTEVCLLVLQEYFDEAKYKNIQVWRKLLATFPSKLTDCVRLLVEGENDFGVKDITGFTTFLESFKEYEVDSKMNFQLLEGADRARWPCQLRKLFITRQLEKLPKVNWTEKQTFNQSLYYLHALYNEKPKEVKLLLRLLWVKLDKQPNYVNAVKICEIFQKFYGGQWSFTLYVVAMLHEKSCLKAWTGWIEAEEGKSHEGTGRSKIRNLVEIQKIVGNDSNTTLSKYDLTEIVHLVQSLDRFQMPLNFDSNFDQIMSAWLSSFRKRVATASSKQDQLNLKLEAVAYINFVFQLKLGFDLRPTQKLAIVTALHQGTLKTTNLLSQIATGEGKTCVVLSVAICRGLFGERTDVVTSSGVLAQRDATFYKNIFSTFGLTVGEVTSDSQEDRKKAYLCTVVYGEATHFERDYLLDKFYNQNIRGSRSFANVIVDEVDCMFLDKGNSVLYLSHQPPDLDSLEALFVFIWMNVVQMVNKGVYHPIKVYELVLSTMYPTITVDDLLLFGTPGEVNRIWDWLISNNVVSKHGRILDGRRSSLPKDFQKYQSQFLYLLDTKLQFATNQLRVINYLKPFVEQHLITWIHSAFQATQLTEGREYVVDVDHSKTVLDRNPRIMILDLDTGVDMKESQWNEGLHQFLELKHGCRLTPMNLKAVFISNITYFNKYRRVFGLTGTIGTESDRQFLKDTYKVQVLCVPLAQPKHFLEQEPVICKDMSHWKEAVVQESLTKVKEGRSVLIICGTVQDAELLFAECKNGQLDKDNKVELYRRDYEQFKATQEGETLSHGKVIIATNLAGRGTDIKLSPELRKNGGLHVILSYLPDNLRVEQQAFGRTARCGDPGSGRLIFVVKMGDDTTKDCTDAIDMKIKRDEREIGRVSDIQTYYNAVILKEEEMFKRFQLSFDRVKDTLQKAYKNSKEQGKKKHDQENGELLAGQVAEMKAVILYSMLDEWAFWLDKYSTILQNKSNEEYSTLFDKGLHKFDLDAERNLQQFLKLTARYEQVKEKFDNNGSLEEVESYGLAQIQEPALLVKAAKVKITRKKWSEAESLLDMAIKIEPDNGRVVAKYYKLFCRVKRGLWKNSRAFEALTREVLQGMEDWRMKESSYASAIGRVECVDSTQSLQGGGYKEQKEGVIRLIGVFVQSVENMVGKSQLTGEDFVGVCGEQVAERLIPWLVNKGALEETRFRDKMEERKVKLVAEEFCVAEKEVKRILEQFRGRALLEVEKELKKILELPSRTGFWKEIGGCLEGVQQFAVVKGLTQEMGKSAVECEKNEFTGWGKCHGGKWMVSKYGTDILEGTNVVEISKGSKWAFKQQQKYRYLRKVGRLCYEQVGTVSLEQLKWVQLSKFCKIGKNDFIVIPGVAEGSWEIFDILVKAQIVASDGELLTTEWGSDKLNLTKQWEVYRGDILAILQSRCRYKYELLSILFQAETAIVKKDALTELRISLPSRPYKDFIMCCMDHGLIQGHRPKSTHFQEGGVSNFFENVFQEPASWGKWIAKQTGIIGEQKAKLNWSDLREVFREESEPVLMNLFQQLKSESWINDKDEILELKPENKLSEKFEYFEPELRAFLQWQQYQVKENFWKDALKIVYESQGKLKILENPDTALVDIEAHLGEGSAEVEALRGEINQLTLSGLDHIVDTIERTYTLKMIFSAIAVIIIGLAQIAVGILLEVYSVGAGTYVASGLISEGIGDLIYGAMAFKSGHFSWQDWVNNKWQSMALTVATMGIGALISKGVQFSKYGFRLFGQWGKQMGGRAITETLKETGKAGIKRALIPVLLKSFGYKVLQGAAVAAGSMAVSYAYEHALKKCVAYVTSSVFAKTDETVENHPVSGTLSQLCDLCGVSKAQEIVNRCRGRVESTCETDAHECFSKMVSPLMNGLKEATSKMNMAGSFSNKEGMLLMTMMQVVTHLMTTVSVVNALGNMATSIRQYLDQIDQEIRKEMGVLQEEQGKTPICTASEKQDFVYQFKTRTNEAMRDRIGGIMQHKLIEPLMNAGCQKLLTSLGRGLRGQISKFKEARLLNKIEKVKFELKQDPNAPEAAKRDLHKQVIQLCSKSRDPKVIAHAVEFGGPLGVESVQALANLLGVTIVVDSNNKNVPGVFEPNGESGGDGGNRKTLHLKHTTVTDDPNDLGHWEARSSAGTTPRGGVGGGQGSPDCLLDAINAELTTRFGEGHSRGQINRSVLADAMRQDSHFGGFIKNGWHHTYNSLGGFGGVSPDDQEITDEGRRDNIINHIHEVGLRMRRDGRLVKREDDPRVSLNPRNRDTLGPIDAYTLEDVNGKNVIFYQEGTVTWNHVQEAEQQSRNRERDKKYAKDDGCHKHDQAGHLSPLIWGAPTAAINMYAQNGTVNQGVNREIEKLVTNFVREGQGKNTVEYRMILENRGWHSGRRPNSHTHYYIFRTNGEVQRRRVFVVDNPACYCVQPERGGRGRARAPGGR